MVLVAGDEDRTHLCLSLLVMFCEHHHLDMAHLAPPRQLHWEEGYYLCCLESHLTSLQENTNSHWIQLLLVSGEMLTLRFAKVTRKVYLNEGLTGHRPPH